MDPHSQELLNTAMSSHDILFKAETVFPFTLFPDTVTIDREKITIANRTFFKVAKIASSQISDIQSIEADVGPFFGSVHITSKFFATNKRVVRFLTRDDALKMRRLVQGFIIAKQKGIDCSVIDKEKLVVLLTDLGKGAVG